MEFHIWPGKSLYDVATFIGSHDLGNCVGRLGRFGEEACSSFNAGNIVFLAKKLAGTDPILGDFYSPADVRPLLIVNTDNRLVANSMRLQ